MPTKCICHKGLGGYSSILPRINSRVGGQDTTSQSLTAHTLYNTPQFLDHCLSVKFENLNQ